MSKATKLEIDEYRAAYAHAVLAFNTATAVLIVHFAADTVPTAEEVATEVESRAAVVTTRSKIWDAPSIAAALSHEARLQ